MYPRRDAILVKKLTARETYRARVVTALTKHSRKGIGTQSQICRKHALSQKTESGSTFVEVLTFATATIRYLLHIRCVNWWRNLRAVGSGDGRGIRSRCRAWYVCGPCLPIRSNVPGTDDADWHCAALPRSWVGAARKMAAERRSHRLLVHSVSLSGRIALTRHQALALSEFAG